MLYIIWCQWWFFLSKVRTSQAFDMRKILSKIATIVKVENIGSSIVTNNYNIYDRMDVSMKGHNKNPFVMPMRQGFNCDVLNFNIDTFLDLVIEDVGLMQQMKLHEILSHNAHVEYLQWHGLNGHIDATSFKQCVPIVNYKDIQPNILCLMNGNITPIFTIDPIREFHLRYVLISSTFSSNTLFYVLN